MAAINNVKTATLTSTTLGKIPDLQPGSLKKLENVKFAKATDKVTVSTTEPPKESSKLQEKGSLFVSKDKILKETAIKSGNASDGKKTQTQVQTNSGKTTNLSSKPTEAQDKKVADTGTQALASYKEQAGTEKGRELLTKALTGKAADKLTAEERKTTDAYMKDVADGKFEGKDVKTPQLTLKAAASGTEKDVKEGNAKLGDKILSPGVEGAYVDEKKTALISNTALDANGAEKTPDALSKTVNEEVGEYIAASASKAGVKIGAGDAGDRMALALKGEDTTGDKVLNTPQASDTAVVRIGDKAVTAKAAAEREVFVRRVDFVRDNKNPSNNYFEVTVGVNGQKGLPYLIYRNDEKSPIRQGLIGQFSDPLVAIKPSDKLKIVVVNDKLGNETVYTGNEMLNQMRFDAVTKVALEKYTENLKKYC